MYYPHSIPGSRTELLQSGLLVLCGLTMLVLVALGRTAGSESIGTGRIFAYTLVALVMIVIEPLSGAIVFFAFEYVFTSISRGTDPTFGVVFVVAVFLLVFYRADSDGPATDGT